MSRSHGLASEANVGPLLGICPGELLASARQMANSGLDVSETLKDIKGNYPSVIGVLTIAEQDMSTSRLAYEDPDAFEGVAVAYRFGFVASFVLLEPHIAADKYAPCDPSRIYEAPAVPSSLIKTIFPAVLEVARGNEGLELESARHGAALFAGTYEFAQFVRAQH